VNLLVSQERILMALADSDFFNFAESLAEGPWKARPSLFEKHVRK